MSRKTTAYGRRQARERLDSISASRMNGTRLTQHELDKVLLPAQQALHRARTGAATYGDVVQLSTAMHKARAIDDAGIYRGLRTYVDAVEPVLCAIEDRANAGGAWCSPTLYAGEITALDDLVWAYRLMLLEVTYAEFVRAERKAVARVATAGGTVIHVHPKEATA